MSSYSTGLALIRSKNPLVLNLTNFVGMDLNANALLAVGASPVMSQAIEEMEELVALASALVVNLGTLDGAFVERARFASSRAKGIPVILDPVGAGASRLRTDTAAEFFRQGNVTLVRANASEMLALLGAGGKTKGVDSLVRPEAAFEFVRKASRNTPVTLVMSGPTDFIFRQGEVATVEGGSALLTKVTAMGCTASALLGAFAAVNANPFEAGVQTMELMARVSERAAAKTSAPGSFRQAFLDGLYEAI